MKKRVLMGLVLLAIIGTSAVFAQQPTLDKLSFATVSTGGYNVRRANDKITGEVVVPDTYNGKPVTHIDGIGVNNPNITSVIISNNATTILANCFLNGTGLKSITIPASVTTIERTAFAGCTNLTSVTFQGSGAKVEVQKWKLPELCFHSQVI